MLEEWLGTWGKKEIVLGWLTLIAIIANHAIYQIEYNHLKNKFKDKQRKKKHKHDK